MTGRGRSRGRGKKVQNNPTPGSSQKRPAGRGRSRGQLQNQRDTISQPTRKIPLTIANLCSSQQVESITEDVKRFSSTDVPLKDLKEKHIKELKLLLDKSGTGFQNWEQLSELILENDKAAFKLLKHKYVATGSVGRVLLEKLKVSQPNLSILQFCDAAQEIDRQDAVKLLAEINPETMFTNLEERHNQTYRQLVHLIEKEGLAGIGWRNFAGQLNLDESDIFRNVRLDGSPTLDLIELIKTKKPLYSLANLKTHVIAVGRNDVALKIDEILKDILAKEGNRTEIDDKRKYGSNIYTQLFLDDASDNYDGTEHKQIIGDEFFYLWCHHAKHHNPAELLSLFDPKTIAPAPEKKYEFYQPGGFLQKYSRDEIEAKFLKTFEQFYAEELENRTCFISNAYGEYSVDEGFSLFCELMKKWCIGQKVSFMLINHSCMEHLEMFGFNFKKLIELLHIQEGEDDPENKLLVYVPEQRVILSIRYVDDSSINVDTIYDKINSGVIDIKLFSALFFELLKDIKICLVSVLVLGNVSKSQLTELGLCSSCQDYLILSKEDITSNNSLNSKLKCFLKCFQKTKETLDEQHRKFKILASKIVGSLSVKDVNLPKFCDDSFNCLYRIYLNYEQWKILYSKDSHVILLGGYGSGKSVLAQIKVNELINRTGNLSIVYFIAYSGASLYNQTLKKRMTKIALNKNDQVIVLTAHEYYEKYDLQGPVQLSSILEDIVQRHGVSTVKPSAIIDEYDASNLIVAEAERIKNIHEKFFYLMIVAQSMDIKRERYAGDTKSSYGGFEYDITAMKIKNLNRTMRNPSNVNELSRITTEILKKHENIYYNPEQSQSSSEQFSRLDVYDELSEGKKISLRHDNKTNESDKSATKKDSQNTESVFVETNSKETQDISVHFDHALKQIANYQSFGEKKIVSKFEFHGRYESGHGVNAETPKIIHLQPFGKNECVSYNNINSWEVKCSIIYLLQNIVEVRKGDKGLCIICFDAIDANLYENVLKLMMIPVKLHTPALGISDKEESIEELYENLDKCILITDHVGCRGMEFPKVIISIDPEEHVLHQFILESLTRTLGELYLTLIRKTSPSDMENNLTCAKIIQIWQAQEKGLVEEITIETCKDEDCDDFLTEACIDDLRNVHKIHPGSQWFDFKDDNSISELKVDIEGCLRNFELNILKTEVDKEVDLKEEERRVNNESNLSEGIKSLLAEYDGSTDKFVYVTRMLMRNETTDIITLLKYRGEEMMRSDDDTLFMVAALLSRMEVVAAMEKVAGCTPLAVNKRGWTALHHAADNDQSEMVRHLSNNYPSMLNMRDVDGCTPFARATYHDNSKAERVFREIAREMNIDPDVEWKKDVSKKYTRRR